MKQKYLYIFLLLLLSYKSFSSDFEVGFGIGELITFQNGVLDNTNPFYHFEKYQFNSCDPIFKFRESQNKIHFSFYLNYSIDSNSKFLIEFNHLNENLSYFHEQDIYPSLVKYLQRFDTIYGNATQTANFNISQTIINFNYSYNIFQNMWISGGPSLIFLFESNYKRILYSYSINDVTSFVKEGGSTDIYTNNNKTILSGRRDIPQFHKLNIGLNFEIGYEFKINNFNAIPFIQAMARLNQPLDNSTWNYYYIFSGLKINYHI